MRAFWNTWPFKPANMKNLKRFANGCPLIGPPKFRLLCLLKRLKKEFTDGMKITCTTRFVTPAVFS